MQDAQAQRDRRDRGSRKTNNHHRRKHKRKRSKSSSSTTSSSSSSTSGNDQPRPTSRPRNRVGLYIKNKQRVASEIYNWIRTRADNVSQHAHNQHFVHVRNRSECLTLARSIDLTVSQFGTKAVSTHDHLEVSLRRYIAVKMADTYNSWTAAECVLESSNSQIGPPSLVDKAIKDAASKKKFIDLSGAKKPYTQSTTSRPTNDSTSRHHSDNRNIKDSSNHGHKNSEDKDPPPPPKIKEGHKQE